MSIVDHSALVSDLNSPQPSTSKTSRKRRTTNEPSKADLQALLAETKRQLKTLEDAERATTITHLGTLAYRVGLGGMSDAQLTEGFIALAKQLLGHKEETD